MKKLTSRLVCFSLLATLASAPSFAAERKKDSAVASTPVSYSSGGSAGTTRWGIGAASYTLTGISSASIAAMIDMDGVNSIQPMLTIAGTSPFQFEVGGLYRHKLSHGGNSGFHIGGGIGLGTTGASAAAQAAAAALGQIAGNAFIFSFGGLAGIHYNLPGTTDLVLLIDAGPIFNINDGNFDFALAPFSSFFGATLMYMF